MTAPLKSQWQKLCLRVVFTKFPFPLPAFLGPWLMNQALGQKGKRVDRVEA